MTKTKQQALNIAVTIINKTKASGITTADKLIPPAVGAVSTGIKELDEATGIGGIPRGHISEIYGREMTGKTMLALQTAAQVIKMGGNVLYIDGDNGLSDYMLRSNGISGSGFYAAYPETLEDAFTVCEKAVGAFELIVIDTLSALPSKEEIICNMEDKAYLNRGRIIQQGLNRLIKPLHETGSSLIVINQVRDNIGLLYGNPETQTGGRALKYYKALSIETRRFDTSDKYPKIKAVITKNKYAAPFGTARFRIDFCKKENSPNPAPTGRGERNE